MVGVLSVTKYVCVCVFFLFCFIVTEGEIFFEKKNKKTQKTSALTWIRPWFNHPGWPPWNSADCALLLGWSCVYKPSTFYNLVNHSGQTWVHTTWLLWSGNSAFPFYLQAVGVNFWSVCAFCSTWKCKLLGPQRHISLQLIFIICTEPHFFFIYTSFRKWHNTWDVCYDNLIHMWNFYFSNEKGFKAASLSHTNTS